MICSRVNTGAAAVGRNGILRTTGAGGVGMVGAGDGLDWGCSTTIVEPAATVVTEPLGPMIVSVPVLAGRLTGRAAGGVTLCSTTMRR